VDESGTALRILNLGGETVDTRSATGKPILTIFAGFAQFEREVMLERHREGIATPYGPRLAWRVSRRSWRPALLTLRAA
jgi:hypothetical protein